MAADLERAEFYLCLARSFQLPSESLFAGLRDALAEDLEALSESLGYGATRPVEDLRRTMAAFRNADELGLAYSTLFCAPPRLVHLNSSAYLDGMVMGGSVQAMERCYLQCGVERAEEFRNLSDHVSMQLEFVAYLYASDAPRMLPGHFLDAFVRHWLPAFVAALQEASPRVLANPYFALARVLLAAVERDAVPMPKDARKERRQAALVRARRKRAARGVTPEDLREIERRLKAKGFATDHLPLS